MAPVDRPDDWIVAPCGCGFGTSGDAFLIEPCSLTCDVYQYALAESRRQHKPITTLDLRP